VRRRRIRLGVGAALAAVFALAAASSPPAAGQSLGAAAERERQRRRAQKTTGGKVYGDQDLGSGRKPAAESSGVTPAASPEAAAPEEATTPALDKDLERAWRARFAAARQRVERARVGAWKTRVETVFVSGIPVQQQVRVFEETEELRAARRALEDLEDELRRAGLPPGWGRE
jgi:hypothetical protein